MLKVSPTRACLCRVVADAGRRDHGPRRTDHRDRQGCRRALPIAIAPFGGNAGLPADIAAIITADLKRSGRFSPLASSQYADRPTELSQVSYASFRSIGVPHLAVGQVRAGGAGYAVQFQLADVYQGSQPFGSSFDVQRRPAASRTTSPT